MEVANHAMRPGILIGIAFSQAEEGVEASLFGGIAFSLVVADEGDLIHSCVQASSDQERLFFDCSGRHCLIAVVRSGEHALVATLDQFVARRVSHSMSL